MNRPANEAQLIRQVSSYIQLSTGRQYQIKLDALDRRSLEELLRLLRDLEHEKRMAERRARTMPWR